ARVAISLALLAPVGFSLGFGLPSGMLRFSAEDRAWFWAVNGATSVLGSVLAIVLSMLAGFTMVTVLGAALYLAAYVLFAVRAHRPCSGSAVAPMRCRPHRRCDRGRR